MTEAPERAEWKSSLGFILAAAGSAVGLGNIWKFPYITGENGGGLFVLIYLVCIALVGIPIMMAEILIGRAAQKQPVSAFHTLQGTRTPWASVGWLGVAAGFIILSYYVVVAGWAMDYTLKSVVNFTGPIHEEAEVEATKYRALTSLDSMRQTLTERRAARSLRPIETRIRARVAPSVWRDHARYEAALQALEPDHADYDLDEVETRLFADKQLERNVKQARTLLEELDRQRQETRQEAQSHYEAIADDEVVEEAVTVHRQAETYSRVESAFLAVAQDGWTTTLWAAIFMVLTILIVARGISGGIERTCRILMPILFVLVLIMVLYGTTRSGFSQAVSFVFRPDPSKLKASGVLEALGHAFFTLSLGMGAMITYGSYQRTRRGLARESMTIALLDTGLAILACLMIFPIIFSYGQEPAAGPGLVFLSMPLAFAEIGSGGMLLAILFFGLLVFAALTSAISLLEVVVSYFIDEQNWDRPRAAWLLGGVIFLFALPSAFSMDPDFVMTGWEPSFGKNFFDTIDYLASNWLLPLGGLFISIYAGWVMPRRLQREQTEDMAAGFFYGWLILIRFLAPAMVILILLQKVGILDVDDLFHRFF